MAINPISWPQANINSSADFSQLGNLGNVYRDAQKRDALSDLGKQLAAGNITYQQAAGRVGELGDIGSSLKFLQLAEARRAEDLANKAAADFGKTIGGMVRGEGGESTPPVRAAAIEPDEPPRAAVEPIPGVIRTNPDGTIAGNVTAPSVPVAPAPAPAPVPGALPPPGQVPMPPQRMAPPPPLPPDQAAVQNPLNANAAAPQGMAEGPTIEHVPMLIGALQNQYLPAGQKELAKDMLKRAWDSAKPTEKISTLRALQADPSLLAIEKDLRKSSSPNINLPPAEKKFDEEMGKTLAEFHAGYIKDALKVPANKATLDVAERAMAAPGFASGAASGAILAAQRALVGLGILDAERAAPNELFQKLQNKAIMDAGGSASGLGPQISNQDARIIRDSTFNATNTPEGNKNIIGFARLMEDRKVEYTREMNKYAKAHGGRIDINVMEHMADWAENNPLNFSKIPGFKPPAPDPVDVEIEKRKKAGNYRP